MFRDSDVSQWENNISIWTQAYLFIVIIKRRLGFERLWVTNGISTSLQ